jgi:hypothetical protein
MDYKEFVAKLAEFCAAHGYEIAGTCQNESIYGEITVAKVGEDAGWLDWDAHKFNFVSPDGNPVQ